MAMAMESFVMGYIYRYNIWCTHSGGMVNINSCLIFRLFCHLAEKECEGHEGHPQLEVRGLHGGHSLSQQDSNSQKLTTQRSQTWFSLGTVLVHCSLTCVLQLKNGEGRRQNLADLPSRSLRGSS